MSNKPFITSLRTDKNIMKYDINSRKYEFIVTEMIDNIPYGYCYKLHKYVLLYPTCMIDDDGIAVNVRLI